MWAASAAWLGGPTLTENVAIGVDDGVIVSLSTDPDPGASQLDGIVLPGLINAHSHAFHRLLRGRTHRQGGDFWLWREEMYQLARFLTPELYEEVATAVYIEMAMAGITAVGEFHYLHHQTGGSPYEDPNEMGHALVRAARRAGIRICLLDAGYFRAGFDDGPVQPVQQRFRDGSVQAWLDRVEDLVSVYKGADDVVIGLAPHSVRAVPEPGFAEAADAAGDRPIHIHLSEQPAENKDCQQATGVTPTALLERTGVLSPDTTLIHATHVSDTDIYLIGRSGASVCYCATTERDLGDGVGRAHRFAVTTIPLCVGSDSHAVVDLFEEIRGIEMHARLASGTRGVIAAEDLMAAATTGGARSLGFGGSGLSEGERADFIVVNPDSPRLTGLDPLDVSTVVFAAGTADVTDTFVAGKHIVSDGHHEGWDETRRFLTPPDQ
ncbi:MAG TPA: formimidoylglutamate deiminase [Acidimicrobiia bacterium]|nr:formimidoylglutamate deiminase [Acidimicrobiia bacterium]